MPAKLRDDPVSLYLRDVGTISLLTAEEERALARQIRAGGPDADEAMAHMIATNLRLVLSIAKRYSRFGVSLLDLVQEGNIGLMDAVKGFDPERGFKFSTYATWPIKRAILDALTGRKLLELPEHVQKLVRRIGKTCDRFTQDMGEEPTTEELSRILKAPVSKIQRALTEAHWIEPVEIDAPAGDGSSPTTKGDFMATSEPPPDAQSAKRQLDERFQYAFHTLSSREAEVLTLRFGLDGQGERSLADVGRALGISRERVRQIEVRALQRLRANREAIR